MCCCQASKWGLICLWARVFLLRSPITTRGNAVTKKLIKDIKKNHSHAFPQCPISSAIYLCFSHQFAPWSIFVSAFPKDSSTAWADTKAILTSPIKQFTVVPKGFWNGLQHACVKYRIWHWPVNLNIPHQEEKKKNRFFSFKLRESERHILGAAVYKNFLDPMFCIIFSFLHMVIVFDAVSFFLVCL